MNGALVIYSPGHMGNEWGLKKDKLSKIRILYMYNDDSFFLQIFIMHVYSTGVEVVTKYMTIHEMFR